MENGKCFFAVDLGATSGRTIIGNITDGRFSLEEVTRFPNNLIEQGGHYYWDIYALYFEIIKGLKLAAQSHIPITSIGIDTWGVDFVFVGADGAILRNPRAYRDPHTFGMMEEYFEKCMDKKKVYDITGIQFMNFNSIFQLYAMKREQNSAFRNAAKILFVPDALSWMLTGNEVCEYTIASKVIGSRYARGFLNIAPSRPMQTKSTPHVSMPIDLMFKPRCATSFRPRIISK